MPKKKRARRAKPSGEPKYLILQDKEGDVYLVTPDRLGKPITNPELKRAIEAYVAQRKARFEGVDFALLLCEDEMVMRIMGNNGPSR